MATSAQTMRIGGLARKLIIDGHLSQDEASVAQEKARADNISLTSHLVKNDLVKACTLANCASLEFGIPLFDLDVLDLETSPLNIVPGKADSSAPCLTCSKTRQPSICSDF